MEIERKYLITHPPKGYETHPSSLIEQAYLCTQPVIRIRKEDDQYYLTYKGKGLLAREEHNLPLTKDAYLHLLPKADGIVLTKRRYRIPLPGSSLVAELDIFIGQLQKFGKTSTQIVFSTHVGPRGVDVESDGLA